MTSVQITVSITPQQASRFNFRKRRHKAEQDEYLKQLREEGMGIREARAELALVRPETWPPLDAVVAGALRRRLAEADLAGPWEPLTREEEGQMKLSGRWPGPAPAGRLVERNYLLPSELVRELRTASWRVSSKALGQYGADLGAAERRRLAALIHSPGRIIRQALDRYGRPEPEESGEQ
ncbi:hypothetical protein DR950_41820 [Kitasatospora xanthocidica]|uniref:Uncharacterized protein n=1 Tax=Kitasatospora xanthocidica TaxID=83382 RepID=A0A372ZIL9_9ACTN|nr:hypothetical protein [Kitasatospora xanthocidica]RGD55404.1 hypothetical protein DR950_41820 [Kitasatospora xanthocidica]